MPNPPPTGPGVSTVGARKYAPRGAGSVRRNGSSWQLRVVIDGVRRSFRAPTLVEARARADAARRAAEAPRGRSQSPTLRDWLATWLAARRPDLRPQAWRQYEIHARVWLVPVLGEVRLDELRREHWDRLVSAMTQAAGHGAGPPRPLSRTTVRHVSLTLRTALCHAVRHGVIAADPLAMMPAPRRAETRIPILTREEAARLVEAAVDEPFGAAYVLAVTVGLREGELLGLRWDDLDLERRTLRVRGNATNGLDGARHVTAPKTPASRRDLTLPVVAIEALAHTPRTGDLVWPGPDGGPVRAPTFVSAWRAARERAGIPPVTFHALRHTAATLALEDGSPAHDVARMLGHSTVATTLRVSAHATDASTRALADRIDTSFGRVSLRVVTGPSEKATEKAR
ncbi:MAG TPA: tyrosine-type recombinase/integrase [Candidatus Binatia bacterium]|nr:tyrosine-type recombinase/integrase [Candidatus Binatia bacterium]